MMGKKRMRKMAWMNDWGKKLKDCGGWDWEGRIEDMEVVLCDCNS